MGVQPNQKTLLIPNKTKPSQAQPEYGTDMRAIETHVNSLQTGVSQIIAGTNITISPTDGTGAVTINSSGGGGSGGGYDTAIVTAGPDSTLYNSGAEIVLGPSNVTGPVFVSELNLFSVDTGFTVHYSYVTSWFVIAAGGESICFLPQIVMPTFTGGGVTALFQMNCSTLDFVNTAQYVSTGQTLTSGSTTQPPASDYSAISTASDITLTAGPGFSGNGLVTNGSGSPYLASVQIEITIAAGTTFSNGGGGGGGSGGYASITGPGSTNPTGNLTQGGAWLVDGEIGGSAGIDVTGGPIILTSDSGDAVLLRSNDTSVPMGVTLEGGLNIYEQTTHGINIGANLSVGGSDPPISIQNVASDITIVGGPVQINGTQLGFFNHSTTAQQSSAGITTVAQLVTVLKNYGLLS